MNESTRGAVLGRSWLGVALAASMMLGLVGCADAGGGGASDPAETSTVRIAVTNSIAALAIWVGDEQGIFEKHGLDMEIEEISSTVAAQVPSLLGRQFDIAQMTPPGMITAVDSGVDVVAVAANYINKKGDDGFLVIASPESGIRTAQDLAGKRIAAPSINGNINVATMFWLSEEGVDPSQVEVVTAATPNMPDLLAAGQVEAVQMVMPYAGQLVSQGNIIVGDPLPAVGDPVQMSFFASARTWAEENPDDVQKYRDALDEVSAWIQENPDEALETLMTNTKVPDSFKDFVILPEFTSKLTADDLEAWLRAIEVVNGFSTTRDMADLIFEP